MQKIKQKLIKNFQLINILLQKKTVKRSKTKVQKEDKLNLQYYLGKVQV